MKNHFRIILVGFLLFWPTLLDASLADQETYRTDGTAVVSAEPASGNSIVIYDAIVPSFLFVSGIGDDPLRVQLSGEMFIPGEYVLVSTKELNGCQQFTIDECRADAGYISEMSFSVMASTSVPPVVEPEPILELSSMSFE